MATSLGYGTEQVLEIAYGSFLADIGMLKLADKIVGKPGKLTANETLEIQKHPMIGVDLLKNFTNIPLTTPLIVLQSHERLDGTGYPKNRKSPTIHKYSKIVSVADVYDAMISKRNWRPAKLPYEAMTEILQMGNQQKLDIDSIKGLLKYTSVFPVGSMVLLSDGKKAKVISSNESDFTKPIVCIMSVEGGAIKEGERIDLTKQKNISIQKVLQADFSRDSILKGF